MFFAFGSADSVGVYLGSLDSQDVRRIAAAAAAAVFVPPDRLLLARGDALMSQRVNLESFEPLGESVTVAPNVYIDSINGKAAVSASRVGPIAYRASAPERELVWLNRSGVRTGLAGEVHVAGPAMSLSRAGSTSPSFAVLKATAISGPRSRSRSASAHHIARGSRGGSLMVARQLAARVRVGPQKRGSHLYVKKLNGPPETLLIESTTDKSATDWSPDGHWIVYHEYRLENGARSVGVAADRRSQANRDRHWPRI